MQSAMQLRCHPRQSAVASSSGRPSRGCLQVSAAVKINNEKQVVISKTLVAKPEHVEEVQKMCKEVMESSRDAMRIRKSGIIQFDAMKDSWEPNTFYFYERYDSNVHMGRHVTSPAVMGFVQKVTPLLESPMGMILYEYRNGKLGHGAIQGGPRGEGGLDDATGATGAAGGASMKQTSSTVDLTFEGDESDEEDVAGALGKQITEGLGTFKNMFDSMFAAKK